MARSGLEEGTNSRDVPKAGRQALGRLHGLGEHAGSGDAPGVAFVLNVGSRLLRVCGARREEGGD